MATNKCNYIGLFVPSPLYMFRAVFTHHQEHVTVFTASDIVHRCCCWPAVCRFGRDVQTCIADGQLHRVTYTRYCIDTIESPDDEHLNA